MYKKTLIILSIALILVIGFGIHFSNAETAGPPWQMFRHDLRHTGVSPFKGAQTNNLKWKFAVEKRITSSPAIGADETIYFGSVDGKLYAVSHEGKLVWAYKTGGEVTSSPAIGIDGQYMSVRETKNFTQ